MRNNKKWIVSIVLVLIVISIIAGCRKENNEDAESRGDEYFYDTSTGIVYSDLSDKVDIKIEKWMYHYDEESEQDRILLSVMIKNKTGKAMNNFVGVITLNEAARDLIASGIITYDKYEPYDLIPEQTANGVSYAFDLLVEKDEWLENINADKDMLLDEIRYITLELSWDGGEETINLVCDKLK